MAVDELDSLDYEDGDELDGEGGPSGGGGGGLQGFFSSSLVRILLYLAAAIVVFLIAFVTAKSVKSGDDESRRKESDRKQTSTAKPVYAVFDLKNFMVNTKNPDNPSLARIKLQLAYEKKNVKFLTELNARRAQLRDIILLFFNNKRKEDMDTAQNKSDIKKELMNLLNREFENGQILDIYYEEFSIR